MVFDVYIDKKQKVWLVDMNTFGGATDALLFSWDELAAEPTHASNERAHIFDTVATDSQFDFRIQTNRKPVAEDPLRMYRGPTDTVELMSGDFATFMRQCKRGGWEE